MRPPFWTPTGAQDLSSFILIILCLDRNDISLLLRFPLELLLVFCVFWVSWSLSLLVLVAATSTSTLLVITGLLLLVKVTGTVTVGEPSSETDRDQRVSSQPSPAPRPEINKRHLEMLSRLSESVALSQKLETKISSVRRLKPFLPLCKILLSGCGCGPTQLSTFIKPTCITHQRQWAGLGRGGGQCLAEESSPGGPGDQARSPRPGEARGLVTRYIRCYW